MEYAKLGHALKKNIARDQVVIASKVYFNPGRLSAVEYGYTARQNRPCCDGKI